MDRSPARAPGLAKCAPSGGVDGEKPENRNYFRGPVHVERVRVWRAAHPGYWRSHQHCNPVALQDDVAHTSRRLLQLMTWTPPAPTASVVPD